MVFACHSHPSTPAHVKLISVSDMELKHLHKLQALMDRSDWKDTPLLSQLEVLEVLDAQSQVLKAQVLPHGAANTVSTPWLLARRCLCDCAALCQHDLKTKWQCCASMLSSHRLLANRIPGTWQQTYMMLAAGICVCHISATPLERAKQCLLVISAAWCSPNGHARQYVSIVKSLSVLHGLSVSMVPCICTLVDTCPSMLAICGSHVVPHTCMHALTRRDTLGMQMLQVRQLHIQAHFFKGRCAPVRLFHLTHSYMSSSKQIQTKLSNNTELQIQPFWRSKASLACSQLMLTWIWDYVMSVIGVALQMCAPREVVLQQMWREEEDGTFIVLLHSTKHRRAATPPASWSWWQPIRAQVCPSACLLTWLLISL